MKFIETESVNVNDFNGVKIIDAKGKNVLNLNDVFNNSR